MVAIDIGEATPAELPPAAALLRRGLGFRAADALPPWLMLTVAERGGICLVARADGRVAGASFAFPAVGASGLHLFSSGLAVAAEHRGNGIGRRLKLAQADLARARGYSMIAWTADPLNGTALRLYLGRLGALLTAYHPGLYDVVRPGPRMPQDDVTIEWPLAGRPATRVPAGRVAVPWTPASLPPRRWRAARARVREEMTAQLGAGRVGVAVEPADDGTCAVVFGDA